MKVRGIFKKTVYLDKFQFPAEDMKLQKYYQLT